MSLSLNVIESKLNLGMKYVRCEMQKECFVECEILWFGVLGGLECCVLCVWYIVFLYSGATRNIYLHVGI